MGLWHSDLSLRCFFFNQYSPGKRSSPGTQKRQRYESRKESTRSAVAPSQLPPLPPRHRLELWQRPTDAALAGWLCSIRNHTRVIGTARMAACKRARPSMESMGGEHRLVVIWGDDLPRTNRAGDRRGAGRGFGLADSTKRKDIC